MKPMDCETVRPWVYLLDDELESGEAIRLEAHLAGCASCRAEREEFLAARERLLVADLPPMGGPVRLDRREARAPIGGAWRLSRAGGSALAAAAAVLLVVAAWVDGVLRPTGEPRVTVARNEVPLPPATGIETLAPARYRLDAASSPGVVVLGLPEIPRQRVATAPDTSWSLRRGGGPEPAEVGREAASGLSRGGSAIPLAGLASSPTPRVGRVDAGRWEMADVIFTTRLADGESPASDGGKWHTHLRVENR